MAMTVCTPILTDKEVRPAPVHRVQYITANLWGRAVINKNDKALFELMSHAPDTYNDSALYDAITHGHWNTAGMLLAAFGAPAPSSKWEDAVNIALFNKDSDVVFLVIQKQLHAEIPWCTLTDKFELRLAMTNHLYTLLHWLLTSEQGKAMVPESVIKRDAMWVSCMREDMQALYKRRLVQCTWTQEEKQPPAIPS